MDLVIQYTYILEVASISRIMILVNVVGYVDFDYVDDLDKYCLTTSYVFTLVRGPIS